tara:strand:+ start:139 stop:1089 length:951 start_codon:yes stop_codon:yes gene_type:complete
MEELKSIVDQMGINISEKIAYIKDNWINTLILYPELANIQTMELIQSMGEDEIVSHILLYILFMDIERPLIRQMACRVGEFDDIKNALIYLFRIIGLTPNLVNITYNGDIDKLYLEFARQEVQKFNYELLTLARERLQMANTIQALQRQNEDETYLLHPKVTRMVMDKCNMVPSQRVNDLLKMSRPRKEAVQRLDNAMMASRLGGDKQGTIMGTNISNKILGHLQKQKSCQWKRDEIPGTRSQSVQPRPFVEQRCLQGNVRELEPGEMEEIQRMNQMLDLSSGDSENLYDGGSSKKVKKSKKKKRNTKKQCNRGKR